MSRQRFVLHAKLLPWGRLWRAGLVVGALSAASACSEAAGVRDDVVVARIGGALLYERDVRAAFERRRESLREMDLPPQSKKALWQASLDDLLAERMVTAAAHEAHITVLEDEVDGVVARLRRGETQSSATSPGDVRRLAPAELRAAARSYLLLGKYVAYQVAARIEVTETDLAEYAQAHPELLVRPALLRLRFLRLPNLEHVDKVRKAVGRGQAPADAAAASLGRPVEIGDLGLVALDRLPLEVRRRTERLPLRKLSEPLPLGDEVAVFWLSDRVVSMKDSLPAARRRIERRLRRERESRIEQEVLAELKSAARAEVVHAVMPSDL